MKRILISTVCFMAILSTNCSKSNEASGGTIESANETLDMIIAQIDKDNVIDVLINKDGSLSYEVKDGFEQGFASKEVQLQGDIICKGSGVSFAKCVKKSLDSGMVLRLYKEGDTYYAEEL